MSPSLVLTGSCPYHRDQRRHHDVRRPKPLLIRIDEWGTNTAPPAAPDPIGFVVEPFHPKREAAALPDVFLERAVCC
jgi:hypothetical protein